MKYMQLTTDGRFLTFRELDDYREGCIEVPDDLESPPLDWIWNGSAFEAPISTIEYNLDVEKTFALERIKSGFHRQQELGYFSNTINTKIDCRRIDLDNINNLILYLEEIGAPNSYEIQFRNFDNAFVVATFSQMKQVRFELIEYGLFLYQRKWQLEERVFNETDVMVVRQIDWRLSDND